MKIDFNKNADGLVPAIIQDATSKNVLMLGYMNLEAFEKTQNTCLLYTSPSPRDRQKSRMPSSA